MSIRNIRYISIFLLIFMLVNFICERKVEASATAAIGTIELLEFLIVCASAGVVYKDIIDAREMFKEFQAKNNPPEPPDPNKPKKAILAMLGINTGISALNLINSIKDFFSSIGAKEGENNISEVDLLENVDIKDTMLESEEKSYVLYHCEWNPDKTYYFHNVYYFRKGIGVSIYPYWDEEKREVCSILKCSNGEMKLLRCPYPNLHIVSTKNDDTLTVTLRTSSYYSQSFIINIPNVNVDLPEYVKSEITPKKFNVEKNSYILNSDENNIKPLYPNLENIIPNNPNVETIVDQNGNVHYKYLGTEDDLLQDLADRSNLQNVYTDKPQSIVKNPEGDILLNPVENPIPEPPPGPGADVNPNIEPEELPFPDVEVVDEPTIGLGFGKIISLLKQLINWVVKVFNRIGNFFKVPEDLQLDVNLKHLEGFDVKDKFPFSIPWDLKNALMGFVNSPVEPEFSIDLDTAYFNIHHKIDLGFMNYMVGFFRYSCIVFFTLFLIKKTRDFIKW